MSPTIRNQAKMAAIALAAGLAFTAFGSGEASAQSPHFIFARCSLQPLQQDGAVTLSFKEAGLGENQTINYTASGDVHATFVCFKGNNLASDPKETEVQEEVDVPATFNSGGNGQVNQSLTLEIQDLPDLDCPRGQRETLLFVSWNDLQIVDDTNNVTEVCSPSLLAGGRRLPAN